ncbi:membrane protein [alpha proteobacterium U9-1i]|nr:membrane protein [alpha proteobacterium U9-1i]
MAAIASSTTSAPRAFADTALARMAGLWFVVALIGQWTFAYYIAASFGGQAIRGDWDAWTARLINGFIEGDLAGNVAVIVHIVLAAVITFLGPLQFIPQIRAGAPSFHRWNGRIYVTTAFVISIGALYMTFSRGTLGAFDANAVKLNGVLIILCAAMTLRYALARKFDAHHRWALRTFLVVSGVWFLRVGYGLLVMIFQGPIPGAQETLDGPTDIVLGFGSYLIPLVVLEMYFLAKRGGQAAKLAASVGLLLATSATAVGIAGAAMIFWLPRL